MKQRFSAIRISAETGKRMKAMNTDSDTANNLLRYYNMALTGLVVEWKLSNGRFDFVAECRAISKAVFHLK